ncbi:PKD domain-containing protein [Flavobacterium beibuense]|uniref:Pkd domain containing protein n=1 Tax=Flavobacterium beibuense TaxID=657326 RepID=A0A444W6U3_9FLAO|nr:PKD domain-containing protein [Flavobacterium beibuense]RYJ41581.1 pkd domain containing protein [Flavobacterium beibuense]
MKKNYFTLNTLLVIAMFALSYSAHSQSWQWGIAGGSNNEIQGDEKTESIVTDADGNVFFLASVGRNGLHLEDMDLTPYDAGSNRDYVIASYSCSGDFRWSKVIGGGDKDFIKNLQSDAQGNIYVGGTVYRTSQNYPVHFDTDTILPQGNPNNPDEHKRNLFLLKYNNTGEMQWLKMPQSEDVTLAEAVSHSLGADIQTDAQGNTYWLCMLPPGTYADGSFVNTTEGDNFFILKYDTNGNFTEAITPDIQFTGVFPTYKLVRNHNTGNFYIAGRKDSQGTITVGGQTITNNMYLAGFNSEGDFLWKLESSNEVGGYLNDLTIDELNNIYITGGARDGETFAGLTFNYETTGSAPFLVKISESGEGIWETNASTENSNSQGYGITINNNEVAVTTGYGVISWQGEELAIETNQGYDVLFARFNKNDGTIIEMTNITGNLGYYDYGQSLAADSFNNYYVGGRFGNFLYVGDDTLVNGSSGTDFFLAKYGTDNCNCALPQPSFGFEQDSENQLAYTFTYNGSGYDTIEWDFGDETTSGEENPSHTFSDSGNYSVCVTVTNECGSQTYCIDIEAVLETDSFAFAETKIYPNPVNGILTISTDTNLEYTLYSVLGSVVGTGAMNAGETTINFSGYESGIYMLELKKESGERKIVRLIKN